MANNQLDINKWIKKNVIGLLAIIVSIIAIVITLKYNQPITTDWLGVLVGVLSLLVVALIGWNIYSLMDFNKIKEDAKEFNESIELRFKKLDTDIKLESTTTSIAIARMITERTKGAVDGLVEAFRCFKIHKSNFAVTIMARESILAYLTEIVKQDATKCISTAIKESLKEGEIEYFLSEFLKYSEEEKETKYKGVQELLLLLVNDGVSNNNSDKSK